MKTSLRIAAASFVVLSLGFMTLAHSAWRTPSAGCYCPDKDDLSRNLGRIG